MATPDPKYERLQGVILPTEIVALPHILKTLDYLLMTHDEALIEAAETGQMAWIKQLLPSFSYDHLEVIIVAARRGQLTIVEWLVPEVRSHAGTEEVNGKLDYNALDTLEEATINAAINGHLEVVQFLMPEVKICDEEEVGNDVDMLCEVAWRALDFTAKSGFLDVVKYLAEYARETEATGPASKMSQALANAIEEGHEEIVRFLINAPQFHWELDIAFNHALRLKNNKIMEIIFELHPECVDGGDLIFRLARDGKQYLQSPEIDWKLVDDAFLNAVLRDHIAEIGTRVKNAVFHDFYLCGS
ncbi:hypothetical protein PHMEG_00014870 [Phytophthora megakarya]|uniref:Uncharacterized protein n=1 Tax=Phytophthora megakarya TaxID=4795 RepID=A0A225W4S0_9STRA|nr:hypothetical protein PHMEG_00014870 [Phytophthora megakarya]